MGPCRDGRRGARLDSACDRRGLPRGVARPRSEEGDWFERRERKETGRDLTSFAIDGGVLLIGVAEDKGKHRFVLAPQPLEGLVERVELIARQPIDPPLHVQPREIPSSTNPTRGYL
jgi:hypothetical protein